MVPVAFATFAALALSLADAARVRDTAETLAALGAAFGVLGSGLKYGPTLWGYVRRRHDERVAVRRNLARLGPALDQLMPNGGASLVDQVRAQSHALGELREELRAFSSLQSVPTWRADRDGALVGCSMEWERITGMSAEEAAGTGWFAALHDDDRARVVDEWRRAVGEARPFEAAFRIVHRETLADTPVLARARPVRSPSGTVSSFLGVAHPQRRAS